MIGRLDSVVGCSGSCGTLSGRRRAAAARLATRLDSVVGCSGSCGTLSGRRRATALLATRLDSVVGCSGSCGTLSGSRISQLISALIFQFTSHLTSRIPSSSSSSSHLLLSQVQEQFIFSSNRPALLASLLRAFQNSGLCPPAVHRACSLFSHRASLPQSSRLASHSSPHISCLRNWCTSHFNHLVSRNSSQLHLPIHIFTPHVMRRRCFARALEIRRLRHRRSRRCRRLADTPHSLSRRHCWFFCTCICCCSGSCFCCCSSSLFCSWSCFSSCFCAHSYCCYLLSFCCCRTCCRAHFPTAAGANCRTCCPCDRRIT